MADITLRQADNGKQLELTLDDVVVIHLPENPTTGYRWALEPTDGVTLQASEYALASSDAVGGGGQRTFKLRPVRPGRVLVNCKHWREWEGDRSIIDRFQLNLEVR